MNRRQFVSGTAAGLLGLATLPGSIARGQDGGKARPRRGVNLAGAEFGVTPKFSNEDPGQVGKDYTYNSERTVAYFAEHGINPLRVAFRWERIQPRLGAPLDDAELGRLKEVVGWAKKHGASVILDPHNFARYCLKRGGKVVEVVIDRKVDGDVPVTRQHFADFWRRLSAAFRDEPTVEAYGLVNEPHDLGNSDWKAISQAAVDAIRAAGDGKLILVPGNSWSNSERWAKVNGPKAWIDDPAGRVAYEAHCYFDEDFSGTYPRSYDAELAKDRDLPLRGARRVLPFIRWCADNGVRGFLGEFGVPGDDPRWLEVLSPFLEELDRAGMDSCWWAAGEWWGGYKLSLQPRDDFRRPAPQMEELLRRG